MGSINSNPQYFLTNASECVGQYLDYNESYCPPTFDSVVPICWKSTRRGALARHPCPLFVDGVIVGFTGEEDLDAFRICDETSSWLGTNFSICKAGWSRIYRHKPIYYIVANIAITFATLSLVSLIISLIIFSYFQSLHCCRLRVHKNLCVALILYMVFLLPPSVALVLNVSWTSCEWLCKTALTLNLFFQLATTAWMFVEGLLLHSRVTVDIFRQVSPFKLYYFIGWGLPSLLIITWLLLMLSTASDGKCWHDYQARNSVYIITAPMLLALTTNTIFLINIVRILITKHRANNATEILQVKKAMKATALLFPLLGITHLLFVINPGNGNTAEEVFWIFNATVRSSQGLIFGILYCFINNEVQAAVRNAYLQVAIRRNPDRYRMRTFRCMSTTSHTYISNADPAESARYKRGDSRAALTISEVKNSPHKIEMHEMGGGETLTML